MTPHQLAQTGFVSSSNELQLGLACRSAVFITAPSQPTTPGAVAARYQ